MSDFVKTIRPGSVRPHASPWAVFCRIEYKAGRLSIVGVEAPLSNGDCRGSCGQIDRTLHGYSADDWTFAPGWDADLLAKFLDAWDAWHLNDMRAYDAAMKAAGWDKLATRAIVRHRFALTPEALKEHDEAKRAAIAALRAGATFEPTPEQVTAATRPYTLELYAYPEDGPPEPPAGYRVDPAHRPERKTLGWVRPSEHPDGLLCRELEPDGPGYGTQWFREEVPADVLDFLRGLPDTDQRPAWV